jgi:hypothetical protein
MRAETIAEQLFFTTVRITTAYANGASGVGTGFLYNIPTGPGQEATFLVTNKHVVADAASATLHFVGAVDQAMNSPLLGVIHTVNVVDVNAFIGHPDPDIDVAIAPVTPWLTQLREAGFPPFFRAITPALALTTATALSLDALEDVTFMGYPNGLFDGRNGLPIARRGSTASPLAVDYEGKPIFLVDAAVYPGSSGSPVFLLQTGGYASREGNFVIGGRVVWLGIIAAVYERTVPVLTAPTSVGNFVRDPLNIGIVYRAETVDALVDSVLASHGLSRLTHAGEPPIAAPDPADDPLDTA